MYWNIFRNIVEIFLFDKYLYIILLYIMHYVISITIWIKKFWK